jgi:hypothetical protein
MASTFNQLQVALSACTSGAYVHLGSDEQLYQVIGSDHHNDRCWLRRWPLTRQGSEVFEISPSSDPPLSLAL